jgi:adenylate cyclase class 2
LKAVDPAPASSAATCLRLGANDHGVIRQRDTYFASPRGRLKLREQESGAELIHYERADDREPRPSDYRLCSVPDVSALRDALEAALGIVAVVEKQRHLFTWRNVRIHLDEVEGLGAFIELEALVPPGAEATVEHNLIGELREAFSIDADQLISSSYCDQVSAIGAAGQSGGA